MMTDTAMIRACDVSDPLIPARILMLLVEKVDRSDMYR